MEFSEVVQVQTDLAYLAGFFDGEGCISIAVYKENYLGIRIEIGQNTRQELDLFSKYFGGKVTAKPDKRYKTKSYRWAPGKIEQIKKVLTDLLPYLRQKKRRAELALEFLAAETDKKKWNLARKLVSLNCNRGRKRQHSLLRTI